MGRCGAITRSLLLVSLHLACSGHAQSLTGTGTATGGAATDAAGGAGGGVDGGGGVIVGVAGTAPTVTTMAFDGALGQEE